MDFSLSIEPRTETGKSNNRRARGIGMVPGIAYSHGMPSKAILLNNKEFVHLAQNAGVSQVFKLKGSVSELDGRAVIVKEIQQDRVKNRVLHVDLQVLRDDEEISLNVRLQFVGEAPGVKVDGGVLTIATHDIGIRCLPKYIPQVLTVDISKLGLGDNLHANAIELPEGVKLSGDPDESIVSVTIPRAVVEEAAAVAAPVEGAAAAPADGTAASAAAADGKATPAAASPAAKGGKEKK